MSAPLFDRPGGFYDCFERKPGNQETTHYCPGCGHGNLHKMLAEAVTDLGIQDRTILINPVGCAVFAYYYLDVGNIQVAHGRAPAAATGVKRAHPDSIVIAYQGDGDLAAIGAGEILHAANRGENLTVFFVNNAIYGMTGGQMAPTTLPGQRTTTTPQGRDAMSEGSPIRVSELLSQLDAPVYIERVALGDNRNNLKTRKAVRRALENQIQGLGFSLVEVLSACPTGWKMDPVEGWAWTIEEMTKTFPLGVFRDRTADGLRREHRRREVATESIPAILESSLQSTTLSDTGEEQSEVGPFREVRAKASGFGGQGALTIGLILADAGRVTGRNVSWLPSYGPEMRGGTAHCHVCLSEQPVGSPLISRPNLLFAMNQPSLERFQGEMVPGGLLLYNESMVNEPKLREDLISFGLPATGIADGLGNPRGANMAMLGACIELSPAVSWAAVEAVLPGFFRSPEVLKQNLAVLEAGRAHARQRAAELPRVMA